MSDLGIAPHDSAQAETCRLRSSLVGTQSQYRQRSSKFSPLTVRVVIFQCFRVARRRSGAASLRRFAVFVN